MGLPYCWAHTHTGHSTAVDSHELRGDFLMLDTDHAFHVKSDNLIDARLVTGMPYKKVKGLYEQAEALGVALVLPPRSVSHVAEISDGDNVVHIHRYLLGVPG